MAPRTQSEKASRRPRSPKTGSLRENGTQVLDLPPHIDQDDVERLQAEAVERDPTGGRILASDITGNALPEPQAVDTKEEWRSKLRAAWTDEKKAALAEKLRAKYASGEIVHPMKGKTLSAETKTLISERLKNREIRGACAVCGRPLSEHRSVANGVGPTCATKTAGVTVSGEKLHHSEDEE